MTHEITAESDWLSPEMPLRMARSRRLGLGILFPTRGFPLKVMKPVTSYLDMPGT